MTAPGRSRQPSDAGRGAEVIAAAARRVAGADYPAWAAQLAATGNCAHPVRLTGTATYIHTDTGEITGIYSTKNQPGRVLLKACGSRRATRCAACASLYRFDARMLVLAGLVGLKGAPDDAADHPTVFATFTAPSFGPVHTSHPNPRSCHPTVPAGGCGHRITCHQVHLADDPAVGGPLCDCCYDWAGLVVWNATASELWRRTIIGIRRALAGLAHVPVRAFDQSGTVAFVKIIEYQTRGLIHIHALLRLDTTDDATVTVDASALAAAVQIAARRAKVPNPLHPDRPNRWGSQIDVDIVPAEQRARLASYLAKYTIKSVDTGGALDHRLRHGDLTGRPLPAHLRALAETAWTLDARPELAALRLRLWAHTLGYRGHWLTKSRGWSTTLGALRHARHTWQLAQHGHDPNNETTIGEWAYQGAGHTSPAEEWLAQHAHTSRRNQQRTAWEER